MAEEWISKAEKEFEEGKSVNFAITHRKQGYIIGGIGLNDIDRTHENAEMRYWIGKQYWGHSCCMEAAGTVFKHSFDVLG
jgi:[ribosomal protein S5]-alanine N-acetyltransferase